MNLVLHISLMFLLLCAVLGALKALMDRYEAWRRDLCRFAEKGRGE